MRAMILAAGLGTRLRPFTETHPKALFEVNGKTLLQHAIEHLKGAGITEVIVNVHHFAGQITDFLRQHDHFGMQMAISDETGELLDTGGGLKKASWFFEGCRAAVIRNVDILSDLDLKELSGFHLRNNALVTLAVRNRETSRYFLFDEEMQLCGWENRNTRELKKSRDQETCQPFAFSGIQVISPAMFPRITEERKFSLTDLYLRLSRDQKILGFIETGALWEDVGKMKN